VRVSRFSMLSPLSLHGDHHVPAVKEPG
jgi:hypothetical protein